MAGEQVKGIYLHGPYGCGKSYIMAWLANKFAENGKKVVFAYYPDLIRQIKSSIATGGLEEAVETLKDADVLFLDDFGGETTTTFIRDEVLGAVLQERMENRKLTFITSNLDPASLHNHLAETAKDVDELKASRIEERITILMEFVELNDSNYRK
jgi:primosomal protein DnaI